MQRTAFFLLVAVSGAAAQTVVCGGVTCPWGNTCDESGETPRCDNGCPLSHPVKECGECFESTEQADIACYKRCPSSHPLKACERCWVDQAQAISGGCNPCEGHTCPHYAPCSFPNGWAWCNACATFPCEEGTVCTIGRLGRYCRPLSCDALVCPEGTVCTPFTTFGGERRFSCSEITPEPALSPN